MKMTKFQDIRKSKLHTKNKSEEWDQEYFTWYICIHSKIKHRNSYIMENVLSVWSILSSDRKSSDESNGAIKPHCPTRPYAGLKNVLKNGLASHILVSLYFLVTIEMSTLIWKNSPHQQT